MKKNKRTMIRYAEYMASSGYTKEEFRTFLLTLRDLRMIGKRTASAMNSAFSRTFNTLPDSSDACEGRQPE